MKDFIKLILGKFHMVITYCVIGIFNTVIDYGIFTISYKLVLLPVGISQIIGFMAGSLSGYILNSRHTFAKGKGRTKAQMLQYIGIDVVLAFLTSIFIHYLSTYYINVYIIKIIISLVIFVVHYTLYKYVVFRIRKEDN